MQHALRPGKENLILLQGKLLCFHVLLFPHFSRIRNRCRVRVSWSSCVVKQPGKGEVVVEKHTPPPDFQKNALLHTSPDTLLPIIHHLTQQPLVIISGSKQALQSYKTCPARALLILEAPRHLKDEAFPPGRARRRPVHGKWWVPKGLGNHPKTLGHGFGIPGFLQCGWWSWRVRKELFQEKGDRGFNPTWSWRDDVE